MNRDNINDISENRRRKRRNKIAVRLIVLCVFLIAGLLVFINIDSIIRSIENIGRKSLTSPGYPVKLSAGNIGDVMPFNGGFLALTDTHVYVHNEDGGQRYINQHAYSDPYISISDTRFLISDLNGRRFSFYGRNGLIYEKESEDRILYGAIGDNNNVAILYRNETYANTIEIYDGEGDWRYKRFFNDNILQIVFTSSDNDIITSSIGFNGGDVISSIQRIDTNVEDTNKWKTALPENSIPIKLHIIGESILVLCDNAVFSLDLNSGELKESHYIKGELVGFDFSRNANSIIACTLLVDEGSSNSLRLLMFDFNLKVIEGLELSSKTIRIGLNENANMVYTLGFDKFTTHYSDKPESEVITLDDEYSDFFLMNDEILLLGYNTIKKLDQADLNSATTEKIETIESN